MELMTKELKEKFKTFPLYSQEEKGMDAEVVVKYFNPYGAGTWLITEGEEQEDGDWLLFGYCHIFEWEWGYISLNELKSLMHPKFPGIGPIIERDLYAKGTVEDLRL